MKLEARLSVFDFGTQLNATTDVDGMWKVYESGNTLRFLLLYRRSTTKSKRMSQFKGWQQEKRNTKS